MFIASFARWLLAAMLLGISFIPGAGLTDDLMKTFDTMANVRSWCYQDARQVKIAFKKNSRQYSEAERRFEAVRAASDAWVDQVRVRLLQGRGLGDEQLRQSAERFAAAEQEFRAYVEQLNARGEEKGRSKATGIAAILPVLTGIGVSVYDAYKKATDTDREKLMQELERMRFVPFGQV